MKSLLACILVAGLLGGCSADKPIAQLKYHKIYRSSPAYTVEFFSNVNFELLYSDSKLHTIVTKYLVCALGDSTNFDVADSMAFEFRGRIGQKNNVRGPQVPYIAYGNFYENLRGGTEIRTLDYNELKQIIGNKSRIDCKVILTVYGAKPYYSELMSIPTQDILLAAHEAFGINIKPTSRNKKEIETR